MHGLPDKDGFIAVMAGNVTIWVKERVLYLHDWQDTEKLGNPDAGVFTRQKCRRCPRTRMTRLREDL